MTLVEELERAAEAEERQVNRVSFHADLLRRAAAMITALKEETLSLLNKPELPLNARHWAFSCSTPENTHMVGTDTWLVAIVHGDYGPVALWAKRRAPARAELPTLTEEA